MACCASGEHTQLLPCRPLDVADAQGGLLEGQDAGGSRKLVKLKTALSSRRLEPSDDATDEVYFQRDAGFVKGQASSKAIAAARRQPPGSIPVAQQGVIFIISSDQMMPMLLRRCCKMAHVCCIIIDDEWKHYRQLNEKMRHCYDQLNARGLSPDTIALSLDGTVGHVNLFGVDSSTAMLTSALLDLQEALTMPQHPKPAEFILLVCKGAKTKFGEQKLDLLAETFNARLGDLRLNVAKTNARQSATGAYANFDQNLFYLWSGNGRRSVSRSHGSIESDGVMYAGFLEKAIGDGSNAVRATAMMEVEKQKLELAKATASGLKDKTMVAGHAEKLSAAVTKDFENLKKWRTRRVVLRKVGDITELAWFREGGNKDAEAWHSDERAIVIDSKSELQT